MCHPGTRYACTFTELTHLRALAVAPEQHRPVVPARLGAPEHRVRHAPRERPHGEAVRDLVPPLSVLLGLPPPGRRCPQRPFVHSTIYLWSCCNTQHVGCACCEGRPRLRSAGNNKAAGNMHGAKRGNGVFKHTYVKRNVFGRLEKSKLCSGWCLLSCCSCLLRPPQPVGSSNYGCLVVAKRSERENMVGLLRPKSCIYRL